MILKAEILSTTLAISPAVVDRPRLNRTAPFATSLLMFIARSTGDSSICPE